MFVRSVLSLGLALSMATPGFAYVSGHTRPSRRVVESEARVTNNVGVRFSKLVRVRGKAETQENGLVRLQRATTGVNNRSKNARVKEGYDRYRVLRPNTRSVRETMEKNSMLPGKLLQAGGIYDRPTRRSIIRATELN